MVKKDAVDLVNWCVLNGKYTLPEFQTEILDYTDIESSIEFGENDEPISMELWNDGYFYMVIDSKGNIIKED